MKPGGYLTDWADALVQRIRVLNVECCAVAAMRKIQLVVIGNTLQQVPCPFETQLRIAVQHQVGFIRSTKAMPKFDVRPRPAGADAVLRVAAQ